MPSVGKKEEKETLSYTVVVVNWLNLLGRKKSLSSIKAEHYTLGLITNMATCESCMKKNLFLSKLNSGNNLNVY